MIYFVCCISLFTMTVIFKKKNFLSFVCPLHLQQCLEHSRCIVNIVEQIKFLPSLSFSFLGSDLMSQSLQGVWDYFESNQVHLWSWRWD